MGVGYKMYAYSGMGSDREGNRPNHTGPRTQVESQVCV